MKCKYCGTQLSDNAKFCGVCGKKVELEKIKENSSNLISKEIHNQGKENGENEKKRAGKKRILPIIVLLCVIVAGIGFFYHKSKGGTTNTTDNAGLQKSKKNDVKVYEDTENGSDNFFSRYYKGYVYYKKGGYLYRQKMNSDDEEEEIYYLGDENSDFVIMDDDIYINYYEETDNLYKLVKVDNYGDVTLVAQREEEGYLYADDKAIYYGTWNEKRGRVEKINKQGEKTKLFEIPEEFMESSYIMDRRYVYYYAEGGIKRIDITQKNCNPELVLKETKEQQSPDDFHPYNDKIYYTDVYSDDSTWYEYDIKTQTKKEILTDDMFEDEGGDFRIRNFRGDYAYIERDSQYDGDTGDIYSLNLKTGKLEWITGSYYNSTWDICNNYIVFSSYDETVGEEVVNFEEDLEGIENE